jgi:ribosomal protein S10
MESIKNIPTATFETVWAALMETRANIEKSREDFDLRMKKRELEAKASSEEFEKRITIVR